jgi:hypothetical protein
MEASPAALDPHIHDPSSSRRGSPAVRAAKDITFGSVRQNNLRSETLNGD